MQPLGSHYELGAPLGRGGMGRVFRAIHVPSGRAVAIKLRDRGSARYERFLLREAAAAAKVRHPRVNEVLDLGRLEHLGVYLVMNLIEGRSFSDELRAGMTFTEIVMALIDVLDGLSAIHAAGVVHGDIKTANVIFERGARRATIVDFGLASAFHPERVDIDRPVAGSPLTMAPEQFSREHPVGPWTDLYSFGVVLHRLVRGDYPDWPRRSGYAALFAAKQLYVAPLQPKTRQGLVVGPLMHRLIDELLDPDPMRRPRFAAEVKQRFGEALVDVKADESIISRPQLTSAPRALDDRGPADEETVAASLPAPHTLHGDLSLRRLRERPTVGHRELRDDLVAAMRRVAVAHETRVVALLGEPGIGKSHLGRWALAESEQLGLLEPTFATYDLRGPDATSGLRHAISRLLGVTGDATRHAWLTELDPALDVEELVGWFKGKVELPRARVVDLAYRVLRARSHLRPLILWLDDAAWETDGAAELVAHLVERNDVGILVVLTMRTASAESGRFASLLPELRRGTRHRVHTLEALDATEREELAVRVFDLEATLAAELADRCDGSPLVMAQMIEHWLERGVLVPSELDGQHVLAPGHDLATLLAGLSPATLIGDRLDVFLASFGGQSTDAERVMVHAALLGTHFDREALVASVSDDRTLESLVDEVLERGLFAGILRVDHDVFSFEHGSFLDSLASRADRMPGAREAVARALVVRFGSDRYDVAAQVASLLRGAGAYAASWERMHQAIEGAAVSHDESSALSWLERARAWCAEDRDAHRRAPLGLVYLHEARLHFYADRLDLANRVYLEAVRSNTDPRLAPGLRAFGADLAFYSGRYLEAERLALSVLELEDDGDPITTDALANAANRIADVRVIRGDLAASLPFYERAVETMTRSAKVWKRRLIEGNLADAEFAIGRDQQARARVAAIIAEADQRGDPEGVTRARDHLLRFDVVDGVTTPEIRALLDARVARLAALGDQWSLTAALAFAALARVDLDAPADLQASIERLAEAYRLSPHDEPLTTLALVRLGERLAARGAIEDAERVRIAMLDRRRTVDDSLFAESGMHTIERDESP